MVDTTMGPAQILSNVYISGYGHAVEMSPGEKRQFTGYLEVIEVSDRWAWTGTHKAYDGWEVVEHLERIVSPAEITIDKTIEWSIRAFGPSREDHDLGLLDDPRYGTVDSTGLYTAPSVILNCPVLVYAISPLFWGTLYQPGWTPGDRAWGVGNQCYCNMQIRFRD